MNKNKKSAGVFFAIAAYCLLLLAACQAPNTTQPKAPEAAYKHTDMQIQSEKHKSVVHVPIELSIADLSKHLNTQVQGLIYEDDDKQEGFKIKVWKYKKSVRLRHRISVIYLTFVLHLGLC